MRFAFVSCLACGEAHGIPSVLKLRRGIVRWWELKRAVGAKWLMELGLGGMRKFASLVTEATSIGVLLRSAGAFDKSA